MQSRVLPIGPDGGSLIGTFFEFPGSTGAWPVQVNPASTLDRFRKSNARNSKIGSLITGLRHSFGRMLRTDSSVIPMAPSRISNREAAQVGSNHRGFSGCGHPSLQVDSRPRGRNRLARRNGLQIRADRGDFCGWLSYHPILVCATREEGRDYRERENALDHCDDLQSGHGLCSDLDGRPVYSISARSGRELRVFLKK